MFFGEYATKIEIGFDKTDKEQPPPLMRHAKKVDEKCKKKKRFFKKGLTTGMVCAIINNANRKGASLLVLPAGVAEQADARDLKSRDARASYRFDPGHRHQGTEKNIAE